MATRTVPTTGNFAAISQNAQNNICSLLNKCVSNFGTSYNIRERMKSVDRKYLRKGDNTAETQKAKVAGEADPTKFQNVVMPIVKPQVETAVSKLSEIFLSGVPIFPVSASAQYQDAAMQMETILRDQEEQGGWNAEFQQVFRDGKKYNLMAMEVNWVRKLLPAVVNGTTGQAQLKQDVYWEGNALKRINLYNAFWDLRVEPKDFHKEGEFFGYSEIKNRTALVRLMWELGNTQLNREAALTSSMSFTGDINPSTTSYYIPDVNSDAIVQSRSAVFDWSVWFGMAAKSSVDVKFADSFVVTTFYLRLIPKDVELAVPSPKTPAVWKFIIVNGKHIIYAEQLKNAHEYMPVVLGQPDTSGLGYQDDSLAQELTPYQSVASAYMNSGVQSMRRAINDRVVYDPSKIEKKDIENGSASAKIPIKAAHYGKPLSEAVYAFPYRDMISGTAMQGVQTLTAIANQASGQNAASQGQFVKGNKTLHEYADVMANAGGRTVNTAMVVENQFMQPIKEMLKLNILQFQTSSAIFNENTQETVQVDPTVLRQAVFKFKMSDGLTPADKTMHADSFSMAFQMLATSPALQSEFNVGELATYMMKQMRADVSQFQKPRTQIAFERAMTQWQQTATLMIEKGMDPSRLPQPKPADFGYDPNQSGPSVPASDPTGKPAIIQTVAQIMSPQQNSQGAQAPGTQPPTQ